MLHHNEDTTVVGRISNNNESAYREEIQSLSAWCSMNNLALNATKTKELIVDFQKSNSSRHSPIYINGCEVERVSSFKFLGIHISEDLSWHQNTSTLDAASLLSAEDGPDETCFFFLFIAGTHSASFLIGGGDRRPHLPPSLPVGVFGPAGLRSSLISTTRQGTSFGAAARRWTSFGSAARR
ncbi:hypothetical protein QTP86_034145 [Hemibagrus guttatus]|nr:hypothetical protein QTP86_034145 [Hemibagrus guttatus]